MPKLKVHLVGLEPKNYGKLLCCGQPENADYWKEHPQETWTTNKERVTCPGVG